MDWNILLTLLKINSAAGQSKVFIMNTKCENLFEGITRQLPEEVFDVLLKTDDVCLERIVSNGHNTPQGKWLKQNKNEWVVLLHGAATLSFLKDASKVNMRPGDYINIPAYCKHRVEWTDPKVKTVWLAIHYKK